MVDPFLDIVDDFLVSAVTNFVDVNVRFGVLLFLSDLLFDLGAAVNLILLFVLVFFQTYFRFFKWSLMTEITSDSCFDQPLSNILIHDILFENLLIHQSTQENRMENSSNIVINTCI